MSRYCAATSAACGRAPSRRVLSGLAILLGASGMMVLAGCGAGGGMNLSGGTPSDSQGASIQGKVYGGQQPIAGAQVYLYANGTSGYGKPAVSLLNSPVTTSTTGGFSISGDYTCPAAPGDQVFLLAVGGNPGNSTGTNSNAVLMAALGSCSSLSSSSFIVINEVTTVASSYALAQFLTYTSNVAGSSPGIGAAFPTTSVAAGTAPNLSIPTSGANCNTASGHPAWESTGASTCNYLGLKNAMATVANMVCQATGNVPADHIPFSYYTGSCSATSPSGDTSPGHTGYVPSVRINTLADILGACVNTNGLAGSSTNCSTLFGALTPVSTSTAPTDTLQAILNLAQAPYFSSTTLTGPAATFFGILPSSPAFNTPAAMIAAPGDWTLVLGYTSGGFANAKPGTYAGDTTTAAGLAIDQQGNIWSSSDADFTASTPSSTGFIVGMQNNGVPITPNSTASGWGGYSQGGTANVPTGDPAIDPSGNIFFSNLYGITLGGITESGSSISGFPVNLSSSNSVGGGPVGTAVDHNDHIWLDGFPMSGVVGVADYSDGTERDDYIVASGSGDPGYSGVSLDNNGNVWVSQIGGDQQISASTGLLIHAYSGSNNEGELSVSSTGDVYGCNSAYIYEDEPPSTFVLLGGLDATIGCNSGDTYAPNSFDGAGNLWEPVLNLVETGNLREAVATGSNAGTDISPVPGYQGIGPANGSGTLTGEGDYYLITANGGGIASISGTAVDGSGNVWVQNGYAQAAEDEANDQIVEFVGLGAPAVTPVSLAQEYNTFTTLP
jgi:hypothetical protein